MKKILHLLYQPYKWLVPIPFFILSTMIFGTIAVMAAFLINARAASYLGGVLWARLNAWAAPMLVKVHGREHIDPNQSYVVIANHQSAFDIFVLYGFLNIDFKWVMKQELRSVPGIGIGCEKVGHIFIDRSDHESSIKTLEAAKKKIVNGTSIIFFPEGTRSMDGRILEFKKGAFKMALDLDLPILPVTIEGTRDILPNKTLDLFPGKAVMKILEPISVKEYSEQTLGLLMQRARNIMVEEMNRSPQRSFRSFRQSKNREDCGV
ncbi:lysophospholipid acyltransferase family protein [Desulfospira joergensenii]|uniref:lysophospholipid acyltransferase family protein n=1 Tax=Desulfospira joergensenii TaxID=53329 RepID=UPI0003B4CFD7|nr:lysophospholipid acyltransferase family protein [Desulfospira joergensenii]